MSLVTPLTLPSPKSNTDKISCELTDNINYFAICVIGHAQRHPGITLITCPEAQTLRKLERACHFFEPTIPIMVFPDWETLPYDQFSPHPDIIAERLETLYRLHQGTKGILLVSANTFMQRLCPVSFLAAHTFILQKGDVIVIDNLRRQLEQAGYRHTSQVIESGEYATRGSVLDIFPMGTDLPLRIDLFDNEVDSIRTFDPETQRSQDTIESIYILPAREFPLTDEAIRHFRQRWRECFSENSSEATIYNEISTRSLPAGIEYYLTLFFNETATLFDYLPPNAICVFYGDVTQAFEQFQKDTKSRYQQLAYDRQRPILAPHDLFLSTDELFQKNQHFAQIRIKRIKTDSALPDLSINHKLEKPLLALETFLTSANDYRVLFCCESLGRREAIIGLLKSIHCTPYVYTDWKDFLSGDAQIGICVAPIDGSLRIEIDKIILITEEQLYKDRVWQTRLRKKGKTVEYTDTAVRNLAELKVGDPVVHIEHGIGCYQGLKTLTIDNQEVEFLLLEYAHHDKLYVPVTSLHLISRYGGIDNEKVPLNRLGSAQWQKVKRETAQQLRDVAAELLALYAKRAAKVGFACRDSAENYQKFADEFPFEETPDQKQAIEQVFTDMISIRPMDRLICGDVGFGKTEVAMRAAFLAVENHKQVAVLVPTTLLAQQHYNTFTDRFAEWPVRIELISRFRSEKEQKKVLEQLENGTLDIIIGTHKLLSDKVHFKDLGLVIIDEEHRFGVHQKDKMKKLRAEVDILTLTATPIPRTLNMALASIRDLSIIATPPQRRLAVKTFVHERSHTLIREAILREILRGGQVYYLHNDVATIALIAEEIAKLVPEASVEIAHGQMREKQLEQIMAKFYHQKFNILVCTTIIETGIDIPTANTIIIDRADRFGLAQLHQLRGRVGRSHHQAYAYLFSPPETALTTDAVKRLEAIATFEDLGAGFALASQDLEIRGAGELLGEEQSGNIQAIGFSLYAELLEETVQMLKRGELGDVDMLTSRINATTELDLHIPALIPESYLPDIQLRLVFYKRIAGTKTPEMLWDLKAEMIDRFGILPIQTQNLMTLTEMRLEAEPLGIRKIDLHEKGGKVVFTATPAVDPSKIISLIQKQAPTYKLQGPNTLLINKTFTDAAARLSYLQDLLLYLK